MLPAEGVGRTAWIGACGARARGTIEQGDDGPEARIRHRLDAMSLHGQRVAHVGWDPRLDIQLAGGIGVWIERPWETARAKARRLHRRLRIHAELDDVEEELQIGLNLIVTPRTAQRQPGFAVLVREVT